LDDAAVAAAGAGVHRVGDHVLRSREPGRSSSGGSSPRPSPRHAAGLADPAIEERLQRLNRESRDLGHNSINRTVLGASRIVPVGDALVHLQPVYVTAGGSGFPRLQLAMAYANGRVG
jgi:hypothetical protein